MSLATDIAADYAVFDGTEAVSFQARKDDQTADGAPVAGCTFLPEPTNRPAIQQMAAVGLLTTDCAGSLWGLGSATPKAGDTVTRADSTIWNIISAAKETLATRWRVLLRKQVS